MGVGAHSPIKTRAAVQPSEESAVGGTVALSQRFARPTPLAPGFEVRRQTSRNVEQLFVVSFWHLVSLRATAASRCDRQIYRFVTLNNANHLTVDLLKGCHDPCQDAATFPPRRIVGFFLGSIKGLNVS